MSKTKVNYDTVKGGTYLVTPPAHLPLMSWGNAKATTGTYSLKANYGGVGRNGQIFENYILVNVIKVIKDSADYYVSISNRGNARFSKQAAEACAKYVRNKIRSSAYKSMVPALTQKWSKRKKAVGLAHQIGMATGQLVDNITAFRTNIQGHALEETRHTGYVVGINQKADFSRDPEKVTVLKASHLKRGRRIYKSDHMTVHSVNEKKKQVKKHKIYRYGSEFLNAKLWWLEHGRQGIGYKGAIFNQPPRPIYTKAVEDFIREEFKHDEAAKNFAGQLKIGWKGTLEFKFKAHR